MKKFLSIILFCLTFSNVSAMQAWDPGTYSEDFSLSLLLAVYGSRLYFLFNEQVLQRIAASATAFNEWLTLLLVACS